MTSRLRRRTRWARFPGLHRNPQPRPDSALLGKEAFLHAIAKERARAERRDLTFCIVRIDFPGEAPPFPDRQFDRYLAACRSRLRITDEIGIFQDALGILLPETIASQAALVASDLDQISRQLGWSVASDIYVWPVPDHASPANHAGDTPGSLHSRLDSATSFDDRTPLADGVTGNDDSPIATAIHRPARVAGISIPSRTPRVYPLETAIKTPGWKRTIDIAGAAGGLLLLSPLMFATAIAIKATSPGPVLFQQWREGKGGKLFRIYKFRTMRVGADDEKQRLRALSEQDGPAFKIKNDPRLTGLGKYLRMTCIDELPQLLNVLKGDMSLVGPRPLPVDESLHCNRWQRRRLDVLPGMTCTWQVCGGREVSFDDWMRMDLQYLRQQGLVEDVRLLTKTALVTVLHRGSV
jgi:lipopolysaccharide/colanic/teichoic acid biosynthesis glycosyltransferase